MLSQWIGNLGTNNAVAQAGSQYTISHAYGGVLICHLFCAYTYNAQAYTDIDNGATTFIDGIRVYTQPCKMYADQNVTLQSYRIPFGSSIRFVAHDNTVVYINHGLLYKYQ